MMNVEAVNAETENGGSVSMEIKGKTISGVIFDIDGVLLDSMKIWNDLGARYLIKNGIQPEEGLNKILFSMSMEQGADYLREHYVPDRTREELLEGIRGMLEDFYFHEVDLKPGARELVTYFSSNNLPVTAATSSPRQQIERALERNGLLEYIDRIFTNSEVGESKHSPKIYNMAAQYMNTSPEETLVFEDSLYALKTAKDAGYITVGVYDEYGESDVEGLKNTADIFLNRIDDFKV